jgi:hypothetical protein
MKQGFAYAAKALYAGGVTALGGILAVLQVPEAVGITSASWVAIGLATLIAVGGVFGLQSAPASVSTSVK